jgi:hypothetical protein
MLPCMKDVLSIDYTVHIIKRSPIKQHWFVRARLDVAGVTWHLIIASVGASRWHAYGCSFDVYMLAYNKTTMYVRLGYKGQLAHLLSRIQQRRFCLLPTDTDQLDPDTLHKAHSLVSRGWTMDDMMMPGCSWLVYTIKSTDTTSECAICKEDFKPGDIAIKLPCSHVFHVHCTPDDAPQGNTTGLYAWVHLHKKNTCPMCRAPLIPLGLSAPP